MIQDSLIKATRLAILSQCGQSCDYDSLDVTHSSSGCGTDNVTLIFLITIRTSDPEQTVEAYRSLGKWIITNPAAFFINNRTYQVDSNCAFLVEDTANSLSCDFPTDIPPTSTTQPTPTTTPKSRSESNTLMVAWISIVVVIVILLVVVAVLLIIVFFLRIKSIFHTPHSLCCSKPNRDQL